MRWRLKYSRPLAVAMIVLAGLLCVPFSRLEGERSVSRAETGPVSPKPSSSLSRVRLIATGGTIAKGSAGRLTAADLTASIPMLSSVVDVEHEQFANMPSVQLTLDDYVSLARRINGVFRQDASLAGIVVTCGSDTLEELAYFLHITVRDDRPVVIVAAMRDPDTLGYDGSANLLAGFRVAAEPNSRGLGVLVVMNDEIHSAREVTKTDAHRLDSFESRRFGTLGFVDPDHVVYCRRPVRRFGKRSEFDVEAIDRLPRVDILVVYQGAAGDLIKAAVDGGAKGIVLSTAGAGGVSGTQYEGIVYAAERDVFMVRSTRTGSGRVHDNDAFLRRGSGLQTQEIDRVASLTIAGDDLHPLKARLLLMLGLTATGDRNELQRMFDEY